MEKIINTTELIDALKILMWDRSKSREELAELAIGLIENAGQEIVRCEDCVRSAKITHHVSLTLCDPFGVVGKKDFCSNGRMRGGDG